MFVVSIFSGACMVCCGIGCGPTRVVPVCGCEHTGHQPACTYKPQTDLCTMGQEVKIVTEIPTSSSTEIDEYEAGDIPTTRPTGRKSRKPADVINARHIRLTAHLTLDQ